VPKPKLEAITTSFYGNCICVDRNGKEMFRCAQRKMNWYLTRGLAEKISEDPPLFKLLFAPKGPGHHGDDFFLQDRENKCVVCGSLEDLTKHHVVPHCYRRFFPKIYNRYGTYDVMMLCEGDHVSYERYSTQLKLKLAEEYDAPLNGWVPAENRESFKVNDKVIRTATTLLKHGEKIPEPRKSELYSTIKEFLGKDIVATEDLEQLTKIVETRIEVVPHGQIVVSKITCIDDFNIRWRKHFYEIMNPQFLPQYWDMERRFTILS
jgi:hypothetical protein